jgi:hypothetical protein
MNATRLAVIPMLACLVLAAAPARAERSIGANLGLAYLMPERGAGGLVISAPGTVFPVIQPGLRFGFSDADRANWLTLDTGLMLLESSGTSFYVLPLVASYEHHFMPARDVTPYVDFGLGVNVVGGQDDFDTALTLGAGLGMRHRLAHGHGAARVELRFDRVEEFESSGWFSSGGYHQIGAKIGFDLYLDGPAEASAPAGLP